MSLARRLQPAWALAVVSVLATGCTGGTETGNPPFVAALSYTGTSSAPEDYGVRAQARVAAIERAWLDLDAVRLSPDGACGGEGPPLELPALGVGDHAAGAHVETSFESQPARFCQLTLPFTRTSRVPEGAPGELEGHSVLLLGELADGTPFSVASSAEPEVELVAPALGIQLSSERRTLLVAFDFAAWLRALPLAEASVEDGAIRIDDSHNAELLEAFDASLASGIALYSDPNGDGVLDEESELLARPRE